MTYEEFNHLAGGIESIATVLALAAAGYWAFRRFVKQREDFPYIEFIADIVPIGTQGDWRIVELISYIENKSKVQHRMGDFCFDLFALNAGDEVKISDDFGKQVHFPNKVVRGSWLPEGTDFFFVEPGVRAKYSFIPRVPGQATFVILYSRFNYPDGETSHSAERTIQFPTQTSDSEKIRA